MEQERVSMMEIILFVGGIIYLAVVPPKLHRYLGVDPNSCKATILNALLFFGYVLGALLLARGRAREPEPPRRKVTVKENRDEQKTTASPSRHAR